VILGGLLSPILLPLKMITEETIIELVRQHIQGSDIFLVEAVVRPGNMIKVHVDRPEGITIQECVLISRFVNGQLDRELNDFSLEVSSPGLSSPFKVKQQYVKNIGRTIEVRLEDGERLEGKLERIDENSIILTVRGVDQEIPLDDIVKAKTIISFN
jgi:ribosome maturation factor RimP